MGRRAWRKIGIAAAALLVAAALFPLVAGRPLVSYPVSKSMEPTLGPFDVFFVDPYPANLREGDIILFHSETQGGPAVHRIVGGDPSGWITKGDANDREDQLVGEPIVTRDRILGRVVTTSEGAPLLLPGAGATLVEMKTHYLRAAAKLGGPERLTSVLLLGVGAALAIPAFLLPPDRRASPGIPSRRLRRLLRRAFPRGVLGRHVALALLFVFLSASAWGASRAHATTYTTLVVVDDPTAADPVRAQAPGGSVPRELELSSLGFMPTLVVLEAGTPGIDPQGAHGRIAPWGTTRLMVRQVALDETGLQRDEVVAWRYPAAMPDAWTLAMHRAMPGLPYAALAAALLVPGLLWYASLHVHRRPVGAWVGIREGWL